MLLGTYYSQNYAGIIYQGLPTEYNSIGHFSPMKDFFLNLCIKFALVEAQCIRILAVQNSVGHALWSTDCLSS